MKIGMICYASHGGSGIVATELGAELASRGHEVHFITNDVPVRMDRFRENLFFHRVEVDPYPVFAYTPYSLNLAAKILDVIRAHGLDLIHAHYAVPHATSAYLAKQMRHPCKIPTVTTLHGTDITLVGVKPSFFEITRFSIEKSDRITAVSAWLRDKTYENFGDVGRIDVVPNFVDADVYKPFAAERSRVPYAEKGEWVLMHASNFRPVKNVPRVLDVFERLHGRFPVTLLFVGDGPELAAAQARAQASTWGKSVHFLGAQEYLEDILPLADLFLLPSEHESFGLAALEAMACEVAVLATSEGGTREVIRHDENGFLHHPHDVDGMVATVEGLLRAPDRLKSIEKAARKTAVEEFPVGRAVDRYIGIYEEALGE
ncbi:N-acetyl-alpha-D-glucosaminyl L-malate synthase BshA [bacterium]|nr:N-acetyl-alpha-D-glucosaminyl L-malate synthase BshA [bacterium]